MNAVERHASRLVARIPAPWRAAVAQDPLHALPEHFGLHVRPEEALGQRRGAGGWCDGLSFLDSGVVLYAPSPYSRRENFTLVHELAHKLVDDDTPALNWIADRPDPGRDLEQLCDHIASVLLMPEALVDDVLAGEPPRAAHLQALYEASSASEPVCAITLAKRLPTQGAVIIMDVGADTVSYANVAATADGKWPVAYPWPRQEVAAHHPLRRLGQYSSVRQKSWWQSPWGGRQSYYLDAESGSRRIHAVLSVYDLWEVSQFHPDRTETQSRPAGHLDCPCGYNGIARGYPCQTCGQIHCPQCKECRCPRRDAAQALCPHCYLTAPPNDIEDGRCSGCR